MENIANLVEKWNCEYYQSQDDESFEEIKYINDYNCIFHNIKILAEYKYEPYQPVISPPENDFMNRLYDWLMLFSENQQKFLFYLASKILFFNLRQINHLSIHIYQRRIKKCILDDIIAEQSLRKNDYRSAQKYYHEELEKTLFVGLTDSSRINDFSHFNRELDRTVNYGLNLETLLYPTKRKLELLHSDDLIELCHNFEDLIINSDNNISEKKRIIIIEDFCGSGSVFLDKLKILNQSKLSFKKVIFAPFIITYKCIENVNKFIETYKLIRDFKLVYGELIPISMKCFDQDENYLQKDCFEVEDLSDVLKRVCEEKYNKYFGETLNQDDKFGFASLKIVLVHYYNCPDNSLPFLWNNDRGFTPLFMRSRRIL